MSYDLVLPQDPEEVTEILTSDKYRVIDLDGVYHCQHYRKIWFSYGSDWFTDREFYDQDEAEVWFTDITTPDQDE